MQLLVDDVSISKKTDHALKKAQKSGNCCQWCFNKISELLRNLIPSYKGLILAFKSSLSLGLAVLLGLLYDRNNAYWSGLTIAISFVTGRQPTSLVANSRGQGARERLMLRETQLRSFYSTTEEIQSLFAKQQEQLKAMQRTLEDDENYDNTFVDMDGVERGTSGREKEGAIYHNNNAAKAGSTTSAQKLNRDQIETSSNEASVTEKHDCDIKRWSLPKYSAMNDGPQHKPSYKASVLVNDVIFTSSDTFSSSKEAQNQAAMRAFLNFTSPSSASSTPTEEVGAAKPQETPETDRLCKHQLQNYARKNNLDQPVFYNYKCWATS